MAKENMISKIIKYIKIHSKDSTFYSILFGAFIAILGMIFDGEFYPEVILVIIGLLAAYVIFRRIRPIK